MSCHRLLNRNGSCQTYIIYDGGGGRGAILSFLIMLEGELLENKLI